VGAGGGADVGGGARLKFNYLSHDVVLALWQMNYIIKY